MSCLVLVAPGGVDCMMVYWVSMNGTKKFIINLNGKNTMIRIDVVLRSSNQSTEDVAEV